MRCQSRASDMRTGPRAQVLTKPGANNSTQIDGSDHASPGTIRRLGRLHNQRNMRKQEQVKRASTSERIRRKGAWTLWLGTTAKESEWGELMPTGKTQMENALPTPPRIPTGSDDSDSKAPSTTAADRLGIWMPRLRSNALPPALRATAGLPTHGEKRYAPCQVCTVPGVPGVPLVRSPSGIPRHRESKRLCGNQTIKGHGCRLQKENQTCEPGSTFT